MSRPRKEAASLWPARPSVTPNPLSAGCGTATSWSAVPSIRYLPSVFTVSPGYWFYNSAGVFDLQHISTVWKEAADSFISVRLIDCLKDVEMQMCLKSAFFPITVWGSPTFINTVGRILLISGMSESFADSLYWFCYSFKDLSLPNHLTLHDDVFFYRFGSDCGACGCNMEVCGFNMEVCSIWTTL